MEQNYAPVDLTSLYTKNFSFMGRQIKFVEGNGCWIQCMTNVKIPRDKIFSFMLKPVKSPSRNILIGVVDSEQRKNDQYSHSTKFAACYYGINGNKYPDGNPEGEDLRRGK